MEFVIDYFATFYCVACSLMGNRLVNGPSYYPEEVRRRRRTHWTQLVQEEEVRRRR